MPFVSAGSGGANPFPQRLPEDPDAPDISFFTEILPTAFKVENTIGSVVTSGVQQGFEIPDPDFDPFADIEGYEEFSSAFINANNEEEVGRIRAGIDRELEDRQLLAAAGFEGFAAQMAAGLIDPVNLIPGGQAVRVARTGNILRGAVSTGQAGLVASTASEVILQGTQDVRTVGESALNIGTSTFLSGVLGAGSASLSAAARRVAEPHIERTLTVPDGADVLEPSGIAVPESVGAATTRPAVLEERLKGAYGATQALEQTSPMLRTAMSPSIQTRRVAQDLVETPFLYEKNALGVANPVAVETQVKMWQAPLADTLTRIDDLFVQYRNRLSGGQRGRTRIRVSDLAGEARRTAALNQTQFREAVGRAARRGDIDDIPEVAQAAKAYRQLANTARDRAIAAKLLPDDVEVKTAASYLSRVWNVRMINARRPELVTRLKNWLRPQHSDLSDAELENVANEIVDTLTSSSVGRVPYEKVPIKSAPGLKERTLNIPDARVEDFLEDDIEIILRDHIRTMSADIELADRFGRADMDAQIKEIQEDFAQRMNAAKSERARTRLARQRDKDLRDISAMRDRLRGTYGAPSDPNAVLTRLANVGRQANYLRLLGGMTVSAIPDLARPVMTEGMWRTLKDGIVPLVTNLRALRIAGREVQKAGTALDMVLDTRAMSLADIGDEFGRGTKFERGLSATANRFGLVSLMAPWNSALKQFTGVLTSSRVLENSAAYSSLSRAKIERLASVGIDERIARRIADQFAKHGETDGGVRLANTDEWTDSEALRAFRSAVVRETDTSIVTPGIGDRPLIADSSTVGKMVFQFRSFAVASTQRMLVSGLQRRDLATMNGFVLTTALGMGVYYLKSKAAGRDVSDDPRVWIAEGIDRSGTFGWLFDVNNVIEKASGGTIGVNALTGGPQMSRFAARNTTDALLGPTLGLTQDIFALTRAAGTGEFTQGDLRKLRRLVPYQNLFYMRSLFDQMEQGLAEELGVPRS